MERENKRRSLPCIGGVQDGKRETKTESSGGKDYWKSHRNIVDKYGNEQFR